MAAQRRRHTNVQHPSSTSYSNGPMERRSALAPLDSEVTQPVCCHVRRRCSLSTRTSAPWSPSAVGRRARLRRARRSRPRRPARAGQRKGLCAKGPQALQLEAPTLSQPCALLVLRCSCCSVSTSLPISSRTYQWTMPAPLDEEKAPLYEEMGPMGRVCAGSGRHGGRSLLASPRPRPSSISPIPWPCRMRSRRICISLVRIILSTA
jgi:hypothetical protein